VQDLLIVFLGTSSGTPSRERNVSSVALAMDGTVVLFDCGEGTQHQLLRAPVRSGSIETIYITHLHGDHVYGLPGLLATMSMNSRRRPLQLVGPDGLREHLECVLRTSHHNPDFPIEVRLPVSAAEMRGDSAPHGHTGFTVVAARLDHSIPAFGYCLIEDDRPGEFDPDRARELGIPPGPAWGELQKAGDRRVCGPPRRGRRVAYCTDTRPCAASVELARGADVLIHESTYAEEMRDDAEARLHSTAAGAARVAREAGVGQLILTHFSTRYRDVAPLLEEARAIFPNTIAAEDLMSVAIPPSR
jgi:ribonuclease Z